MADTATDPVVPDNSQHIGLPGDDAPSAGNQQQASQGNDPNASTEPNVDDVARSMEEVNKALEKPPADSQPSEQDQANLQRLQTEAVQAYGFPQSMVEGKSAEELEQAMIQHDQMFLNSGQAPNGMMGQQQQMGFQQNGWNSMQQQPQNYQQQFDQQQQMQNGQFNGQNAQVQKPDWSNPEQIDPEAAKVFDYFQTQIQHQQQQFAHQMEQMQQMVQQAQLQPILDNFNRAVDELQSDSFGTGGFQNQMQMAAREQLLSMADNLVGQAASRGQNLTMDQAVKRAARAFGSQFNPGLLQQAQQRNGQITGAPQRSTSGAKKSAYQVAHEKLTEHGAFEPDLGGFLD